MFDHMLTVIKYFLFKDLSILYVPIIIACATFMDGNPLRPKPRKIFNATVLAFVFSIVRFAAIHDRLLVRGGVVLIFAILTLAIIVGVAVHGHRDQLYASYAFVIANFWFVQGSIIKALKEWDQNVIREYGPEAHAAVIDKIEVIGLLIYCICLVVITIRVIYRLRKIIFDNEGRMTSEEIRKYADNRKEQQEKDPKGDDNGSPEPTHGTDPKGNNNGSSEPTRGKIRNRSLRKYLTFDIKGGYYMNPSSPLPPKVYVEDLPEAEDDSYL